ncbi:YtxH domain-containing protein [Flavobacterium silvaticum]|uniref:YtxH domain-containing protein n=1 Tax=Flavobacterium silvaticum TaxID=1852020 RepID=A0A972FMT4_9FLAO|nr:YtxH domain-containing protein [Flavobacterium silvaticum]NMH28921.1 YtxH domain-containing protein [Flavobacterium silvaticum]
MSTGKILLSTLIGIAVGAAVGVLIAPDKGSETRRKLRDNGGDYLKNLKDKYNSSIDAMTSKLDEIERESQREAQEAE